MCYLCPLKQWRAVGFDDYFVVEAIDPTTFAIGEPRYYQGNYSYLILGAQRAILFDAGTGLRDIEPVVRSLTRLPVTVIASHLHFDHVGALGRFEKTALVDEPSLRARAKDSRLTLRRYSSWALPTACQFPRFGSTNGGSPISSSTWVAAVYACWRLRDIRQRPCHFTMTAGVNCLPATFFTPANCMHFSREPVAASISRPRNDCWTSLIQQHRFLPHTWRVHPHH